MNDETASKRRSLDPPFSRMGEGGAERRMRACPRRLGRQRRRCVQTISGSPSPLPSPIRERGSPRASPLGLVWYEWRGCDEAHEPDPSFSRMGEGGAERRMRACPRRLGPQRRRCVQTISGSPSPLPSPIRERGSPRASPLGLVWYEWRGCDEAHEPDPSFSRMGEGGAERRMRACPRRFREQRRRCVQTISGGPSPLPLSHPGEGFPALFAAGARLV